MAARRKLLPTLGWSVISWIETHLRHGPGDVHGQPWVLDDEQRALLLSAYEVDPKTGRRVWDEVLFSRAKGRAKSELAGGIVVAEAVAPVRCDHWAVSGEVSSWGFEYEPGEPVGRQVVDPFVRCLATEEGQAGNTYDNVTTMLDQAARDFPEVFGSIDLGRKAQSSTRVFIPGGGEIVPSTSGSASKDGGKETFAVFDETHLYVLPEHRAMYGVVTRNLEKRAQLAQPWGLQTSTMFREGEGSVAEATMLAGKDPRTTRLLIDHVGGNPDVDLWDDAAMRAELRKVYGPFSEHMDLDRVIRRARRERDPADAYRYWLNVAKASADAWIDVDAWGVCTDRRLKLRAGDRITLGFDGSGGTDDPRYWADSTGLVACRMSDGALFRVGVWEAPRRGPWRPPRTGVDKAVDAAFRRYDVARMYCDPPGWQTEIDAWRARYGLKCVLPFSTFRAREMSAAIERLETDVKERTVRHDGDDVLTRHVVNCRRVIARGVAGADRILVRKSDDEHKIDLAICAVLAYEARNDAIAQGLLDAEEEELDRSQFTAAGFR